MTTSLFTKIQTCCRFDSGSPESNLHHASRRRLLSSGHLEFRVEKLASGLNPGMFHLDNLLLHLLACFYVFAAARIGPEQVGGSVRRSIIRHSPHARRIGGVDHGAERCALWRVLFRSAARLRPIHT